MHAINGRVTLRKGGSVGLTLMLLSLMSVTPMSFIWHVVIEMTGWIFDSLVYVQILRDDSLSTGTLLNIFS